MSGLDLFALLVLILIGVWLVVFFCFLAMLPGRIAVARNHVYADAITVGGWLSLILGGLLWPFVLVWAHMSKPSPANTEQHQPVEQSGSED